MRIGLTYNLKKCCPVTDTGLPDDIFAEWDDEETIGAVCEGLSSCHDVVPVEATGEAHEQLHREHLDLVFNIAEGLKGSFRESYIPTLLEMLGIPYTGSDPLTLAICLDKARAKQCLTHAGIPTAAFTVVSSSRETNGNSHFSRGRDFSRNPAIVKPLREGSSKGVRESCLVHSHVEMRERIREIIRSYDQPAIIEDFLPGREFTVAVLGNGNNARVLPIVEIKLDELPEGSRGIYSYEAKWLWDRPEKPLKIFKCPAEISADLAAQIEDTCLRTYDFMDCRDWCRIDVRLDKCGVPHILELNPLPGILPDPDANSCFPKAARTAGIGYEELLLSIVDMAAERAGLQPRRSSRTAAGSRRTAHLQAPA